MARKAAWEDMGDADLGPYAKSRGTRWGRVLFGLLFVVTVTFVVAYYVPLYRAHQRLSAQFSDLNQRSQGLADQVTKAQSELKGTTEQRDALQAEHDQRESAKKADSDRLERVRAALSSKLDRFVKKGNAAVVVSNDALFVAFESAMLFAPQKLDVNPAVRGILCDVLKTSEAKSAAVRGSSAEGVVVPPALAASYPGAFGLSAARAAAIAQVLEQSCSFPAAALSATGNGTRDPLAAALAALRPGERVELELSLH